MTEFPRSVKNAMRTIKTYCKGKEPKECYQCDVCYVLRNISPCNWDIDELELETNCQYVDKCADLVFARLELSKAMKENQQLKIQNEVLKIQCEKMIHLLDVNHKGWREEIKKEVRKV